MVFMPLVYSITAGFLGLNGILIVNGVVCLATLVPVLVWYPTKTKEIIVYDRRSNKQKKISRI